MSQISNKKSESKSHVQLIESSTNLFHRVVAEKLIDIFSAHPSLLVDKSREIKEFLANLRILKTGSDEFYLHLVRILLFSKFTSCCTCTGLDSW